MRTIALPPRAPMKVLPLCIAAVAISPWVLCSPSAAQLRVEAYAGRPFGVARATVGGLFSADNLPTGDSAIEVAEAGGRVFYPAVQSGPGRRFFRNLLDTRVTVTVYFLFRGDAPLDVTLYAGRPYRARVEPIPDRRGHERFMGEWWREYNRNLNALSSRGGFPPLVQNYLISTLGRRLQLPIRRQGNIRDRSDADQVLGLVLGTDSIRIAMQKERLLDSGDGGSATLPLPPPIGPPAISYPEPAEEIEIDAIAAHVPEECFYMRFGNFVNFQWLRDWLDQWGGDLRNLVTRQGVDYAVNGRVERQLALREDQVARLVGPAVISDVALIGFDTFLREGAAIGVLFEARNSFLLSQGLNQNRAAFLNEVDGAQESKIKIGDHEVSFLFTEDNRLRSFYAIDGDYHLVTNCRELVERFYQAGDGERPLSQAADFLHARQLLPASREDTIFIHLSDAFFRNLVGPHYRVEMTRRLASVTDMESWQLAVLAARNEGQPSESLHDLIAGGFLPPNFGERVDGSRIIWGGAHPEDSLRGMRGTFLPIPDVEIQGVTPEEAASYGRFAEFYARQWERMDPVVIGIRRDVLGDDGLEQISLDLHASPLAKQHYGFLMQLLGPPTYDRIPPRLDDLVFAEAMMGGRFFAGRPYRLFFGLRSYDPVIEYHYGRLRYPHLQWNSLRAYIGTTPDPGPFRLFAGPEYVPPQGGIGPARTPIGDGWQQTEGDVTVFSPQREIVEEIVPTLEYEPIERPAQIRLHVKNLSGTELEPLVNRLGYGRTLEVSEANAALLQAMSSQLGVPREDALTVTEELLDVRLVSPLGGEYELVNRRDGPPRWMSTAQQQELSSSFVLTEPGGYQFPLLSWFRGLDLDFLLNEEGLSAHASLLMEPPRDQESYGQP